MELDARRRGQVLFYPPDVSGWDDKRWLDTNTVLGRWDVVNEALTRHTADPRAASSYPAETAAQAVARARDFWDDPPLTDETLAALDAYASTVIAARRERRPARPAPERAADADRHVPRLPDLLSMACPATTSRAPRPAGPARRSSPACPTPRAPACRAASFLRESAAWRWRCSAARAGAGRAEAGIDAAAPPPAPAGAGLGLRSSGGLDSLSLLAPVGDSALRELRPTLAVPASANAATAFAEDPTLQWHPNAAPLRDLHLAGKVSVMPAIGYDDPNQSHFTSRHYWEVGELNPFGRIGWLGRYLDSTAPPTTRCRASRSTDAGAGAGRLERAGRGGRRARDFSLDARRWDAAVAHRLIDALGTRRAACRPPTRSSKARVAAVQTGGLRGQLGRSQGTTAPWQPAVAYPSARRFPRRLAALAEMLDMGLPMRCVAHRRQRRLRHARQPERPRCRATSRCCRSRWPPSRPTSRRAASPTACWCTSGASSAAARRRTAAAPTTAPAGCRC